jgi:hypothetical protein
MWDMCWTKWRWDRFSPSNSVSPANLHSTNFSTIAITYHPELVQQASSGRSTKRLSLNNNTKKITDLAATVLGRVSPSTCIKYWNYSERKLWRSVLPRTYSYQSTITLWQCRWIATIKHGTCTCKVAQNTSFPIYLKNCKHFQYIVLHYNLTSFGSNIFFPPDFLLLRQVEGEIYIGWIVSGFSQN